MRTNCPVEGCTAPVGMCKAHMDTDYLNCEHFGEGNKETSKRDEAGENPKGKKKQSNTIPWTGEPFQPEDIELISARSSPVIVGMVGTADAGKTSYLGMLYTLLFNGKKFENWSFAGSQTIGAWETLAQYMKIRRDGTIKFPPPTPSNRDFYKLYHLSMKRNADAFRDILFADSSGEVFSKWSVDITDPSAENAQWIYQNASAFIFFVDSDALIKKRGAAKQEIAQIAEQVSRNLNGRPITIVWSKSDLIEDIRPTVKASLVEDLSEIFPHARVLQISNFSKENPDEFCHTNNIAATEFLLEELNRPSNLTLAPAAEFADDFFFNYRRYYE